MCIHLIFTFQPNLVVESCVHPSLHTHCHHQIVLAKFNDLLSTTLFQKSLTIIEKQILTLSDEQLETSNGKKPSITLVLPQKYYLGESTFLVILVLQMTFSHYQLSIKPVLKALSNYIPHETLTCDDEYPPWFNSQIQSGIMLDSNLSYEQHMKSILNKVNKMIGLLCKFQLILPRHSLITIYKTFNRPYLDYGDAVYLV